MLVCNHVKKLSLMGTNKWKLSIKERLVDQKYPCAVKMKLCAKMSLAFIPTDVGEIRMLFSVRINYRKGVTTVRDESTRLIDAAMGTVCEQKASIEGLIIMLHD